MFEIVIALAISALIITGIVSLVASSIRNSTYSKNSNQAAIYAQQATEWLRGQRDSDMDGFIIKAQSGVWCLVELSWNLQRACIGGDEISDTLFKRQVNFNITTVNTKTLIEADIVVTWQDSQGIHEVRSTTNFSDWRQR